MPVPVVDGIPQYRGSGVYRITNRTSGKIYVGSSSNVRTRLMSHRRALRTGKHENQHLQRSWSKHGESQFTYELLEACEVSECCTSEQKWIDSLETTDPTKGYNISVVVGYAMLGRKHSEESKLKMSAKRQGWDTSKATVAAAVVNRGKKRSPESVERSRQGLLGIKRSEATKEKVRENHWTKHTDPRMVSAMNRRAAKLQKMGMCKADKDFAARKMTLAKRLLHARTA